MFVALTAGSINVPTRGSERPSHAIATGRSVVAQTRRTPGSSTGTAPGWPPSTLGGQPPHAVIRDRPGDRARVVQLRVTSSEEPGELGECQCSRADGGERAPVAGPNGDQRLTRSRSQDWPMPSKRAVARPRRAGTGSGADRQATRYGSSARARPRRHARPRPGFSPSGNAGVTGPARRIPGNTPGRRLPGSVRLPVPPPDQRSCVAAARLQPGNSS